jgi:hypothetical protein
VGRTPAPSLLSAYRAHVVGAAPAIKLVVRAYLEDGAGPSVRLRYAPLPGLWRALKDYRGHPRSPCDHIHFSPPKAARQAPRPRPGTNSRANAVRLNPAPRPARIRVSAHLKKPTSHRRPAGISPLSAPQIGIPLLKLPPGARKKPKSWYNLLKKEPLFFLYSG